MDIRVLRYFLTLAREGNLSAAAEVIHTTQPNLSRQLAELERELGKKLFIRGSRKITLTDEGMFLRKRAQEIVDLHDKTEMDFKTLNELSSGEVSIGAGETDAMRIVARAINRMQEKYPAIQYHITSGNTFDITERLDKGLLDFCLLFEPIDMTKYDYIKFPVVDTWGVLMRRDSALVDCEYITPADLFDKPLIYPKQALGSGEFAAWFGVSEKQLNIVATFNLITTPAMMVEEGVGYALSFDRLVNSSGDCNLCFRPLKPKIAASMYLVWKKYQILTKSASKFLDYIKKEVSEI